MFYETLFFGEEGRGGELVVGAGISLIDVLPRATTRATTPDADANASSCPFNCKYFVELKVALDLVHGLHDVPCLNDAIGSASHR